MVRQLAGPIFVLALLAGLLAASMARAGPELIVHVFWQQGCPYCEGAKADLQAIAAGNAEVQLSSYELGTDIKTGQIYEAALSHFGYEQAAVPLVVIGERSFLGYFEGGHSAKQYGEAVNTCLQSGCRDILAEVMSANRKVAQSVPSNGGAARTNLLPEAIEVPILGSIQLANLSLVALTILLAGVDGFNPCAMWVLVFLIGLLLGLKDEKRMWILGAAFLGATAIMYFAVMTAWLNVFLFLGALAWIRVLVSLLAIGGGFYFLREYWTKPESVCHVTSPGRRQKIMAAFRATVQQNRLVLSIAGIMTLAVLVNFIELLCSAGIPAVYTQILAMNNLPVAISYFYVGLYVAVFMVDDIAIFITAMTALRVSGLTGSYARYSHLIGGVVLLMIGAIMLLRPELLSPA